MIPTFGEGAKQMGSKKRAAWSKAKSEFLGAATGGDMSDLFAREGERRDALDAERDEAWRYTGTTHAPRPRPLWPTAKTADGVVWPATNANTVAAGT